MNQDPTYRALRLDTLGETLPKGSLWGATGLAFLLALLFFTFLYAPSPLIYDSDSYYHLAVAREYASEGIVSQLPWLRFGLLAEHFGDKELLLHLFLAPLTYLFGPQLGGRIGLALLGALILAIVAHFSLRAVGAWGMLVPFWLLIGSTELTWRLVRLRAELLSLAILLVALWLAGRRRYRWLGPTGGWV